MSKQKYIIGSIIHDKWVIVAILKIRKQNKKLLCFNLNSHIFTEGWIWDFTRDLIPDNKVTKNPMCMVSQVFVPITNLKDWHSHYAYKVYLRQNNLSRDDFFILRDIREGWYKEVGYLLKKFDLLLFNSGQARRNKPLAMVIATTYVLLADKKYFIKKEVK